MANNENNITEFLTKLMLQKYKDKFVGGPLFVESVGEFSGFLSDPNKLEEVGMTVFEINRFKRLCRETIEELQKKEIGSTVTFQSKNTNYPPLCIQPPLQVKSSECLPPAMIPVDSDKIAVYVGNAKDMRNDCSCFDVLSGEKRSFDVEEFDKNKIRSVWLTDDIPSEFDGIPEHAVPEKLNKPVCSLARTKRLLQELAHYATDPHESFEIYPCEENIDLWQLILVGPENTCYEDGIFHLFIEFTDKYPSKPPNIRFITPIYHCNINQAGEVCRSILDRFYVPGLRIKKILHYVFGLLIDPAPEDPLDSVKANELKFDPTSYNKNAKAYTEKHANNTKIDLRIKILGGKDDITQSIFSNNVDLVCPLTMQLLVDPVTNNEGDTYEREAILEHIRSGKEYDPFSRLPLKEKDLRPSMLTNQLVKQYLMDIGTAGKLK